MKIIVPARYASSRFPGKPLVQIAGMPMIERVWQRAVAAAENKSDVFVATDDDRIEAVALDFGANVIMTAEDHETGTDRLAEVVKKAGFQDNEVVVNVQGDEPLIDPSLIRLVAEALDQHPGAALSTAAERITNPADIDNPNIVKVVLNQQGFAHYFSRSPIPFVRDDTIDFPFRRHIGIYAYRASTLKRWPDLTPAPTEQIEKLEQLRAMWHGLNIFVADYEGEPAIGVDTPADVELVEAQISAQGLG